MQPFVYDAPAARIIFGHGTRKLLAEELRSLGCSRALVLSTAVQTPLAASIIELLGQMAVGLFAQAEMHTPIGVTERALDVVGSTGADAVVPVGGGSTIGLGKAIALRTGLRHIALPTTYAGSEATPILGETRHGRKTTQKTIKVVPTAVIYDVDLTISLPTKMSVTSGINAIAHAAEAIYATNANPVTTMLAQRGLSSIAQALPKILAAPDDRDARASALFGAWACGVCLGSANMALHHKLCHSLGAAYDLPHAELHTILLPHSLAYNRNAAPRALKLIAASLDVEEAPGGLFNMLGRLNAPRLLKDIGMPYDELDRASELASADTYSNPAPVTQAGIRSLLERAFHGDVPA